MNTPHGAARSRVEGHRMQRQKRAANRRSKATKSARSAQAIDAHIGGRLRTLREAHAMSQEHLARGVDVSFQQIQKYERGANRISASRLHEFAILLAVPVEAFFDGLPPPPIDESANAELNNLQAFTRSRDGRVLLETFEQIKDAKARRQVLLVIKTLAPPVGEER